MNSYRVQLAVVGVLLVLHGLFLGGAIALIFPREGQLRRPLRQSPGGLRS